MKIRVYLLLLAVTPAAFDANTRNVMKIKSIASKNNKVDFNTSVEDFQNSPRNDSDSDGSFIKSTLFPPDLHRVLLALNALPSSSCKNDSKTVMEGVVSRQRWALKMFDSSPKFPVGMLYGSYYQLGNFDECISINEQFSHLNRFIQGQYCLADIGLDTDNGEDERIARSHGHFYDHESGTTNRMTLNNTLHWAICVPSSCTPKEVEQFLDELFKIAISYKAITIQVPEIRCHYQRDISITTPEIIYGIIVGIFLVFIVLATIYHMISIYRKSKSLEYNIDADNTTTKFKLYHKIILSFSLIQSIRKLLHVEKSDLNLDCISGIKLISMILIVGSHTLLFLVGGPVANEEFYFKAVRKPQNTILLNNPLLVDTFLLVGGFLMCRLLLLELERRGKINILLLYIARYIRLTPSYLIIIGLYCTYLIRLDNGPLWNERMTVERNRCIKSWWANALYINNYVNTGDICMFQSWYLSVDTQLFILAPFIIYPLWKWPRVGELLLGIVTFVAALIPFIITYVYELDPTQMAFPSEISDIAANSYFVFAYMKTHMRATSYCIGLVAGYIVHKMQCSNTKISNRVLWVNWILATVLGLSSVVSIIVFYLPGHKYNAFEAAAYASLHKIAWSTCIAWIIISCVTDNAGPVKRFLTWTPFAPLSRLTYCAYLVNGLVALHSYGTLRAPTYMSVSNLTSIAFAHVILTFGFGFALCVLFESPIHSLEKLVLRRDDKPKVQHQQITMVSNKM